MKCENCTFVLCVNDTPVAVEDCNAAMEFIRKICSVFKPSFTVMNSGQGAILANFMEAESMDVKLVEPENTETSEQEIYAKPGVDTNEDPEAAESGENQEEKSEQ